MQIKPISKNNESPNREHKEKEIECGLPNPLATSTNNESNILLSIDYNLITIHNPSQLNTTTRNYNIIIHCNSEIPNPNPFYTSPLSLAKLGLE